MKKLAAILLGVGWLCILMAGFLAYMVVTFEPSTKIVTDGLGRTMSPAPALARIFLLGSERWAGLTWFFGDFAIFWGWVAITTVLAKVPYRRGSS
jgi:hypothetical protein